MANKIQNTSNPFVLMHDAAELLVQQIEKLIENAPPLGSPEQLAMIDKAVALGESCQARLQNKLH